MSYDVKRSPIRHLYEQKYGVIGFNKGAAKFIKSRPGNCCQQDFIDRDIVFNLTSRRLRKCRSVTWCPKVVIVNVYYKKVIESEARSYIWVSLGIKSE